jgi:hypothetical protein
MIGKTMTKLDDANKAFNTVAELEAELDKASNTLLPLLKEYLKDVRNVRMAFAEETRHIISSVSQFKEVGKINKDLGELVVNLDKLQKILTPEMITILGKLTKE